MEISRTAVGILAGLCVAGGAGGALLVQRSGAPVQANQPELTAPAPDASNLAAVPGASAPAPLTRVDPAPARTTPVRRTAPRIEREPAVTYVPVAPPAPESDREPAGTEPFTPGPLAGTSAAEPVAAAEPPPPAFEELVVSADSVVGLQVETALSSETARLEDEVVARVTRDIRVADRVAIPAGSQAYGEVTFVGRGGRVRDRARLGVTFTSIVLGDGTRVPIATDTIYREGDSPTGESAAKIGGGALGGAIIGGILGGGKGAAIGGSVGAGAGTAAVLAGGRNAATLPTGTAITVRLLEPAVVTVAP